jgi:hypothetical protein
MSTKTYLPRGLYNGASNGDEKNPNIAILQILNEYRNIFQGSESTDMLEKSTD